MRHILTACTALLFAACTNTAENNREASDSATTSSVHAGADPVVGFATGAPFVLDGCYEMIMKKDTATLSLQVSDTLVSGNLNFYLYERDKNEGTIKGRLHDSLIIADYTFQSEGTTSVREVVFKIKDSTLVQAFGDIVAQGDKFVFRDPASLQYMHQNPFVKVPCKE